MDAAQGTVATGNDLSSLLADLAAGFSALASQPSSAVQQQAVVGDAATLAGQINALGDSYVQARQTAQDGLVGDVGTLNTQLALVGSLSDRIIAERQAGRSTADLQGQRDAALTTISGLVGIRTLDQPNGDVIVSTDGGLQLPVHANGDPRQTLQIAAATIGPDSARELGNVPAITLGGADITTRLAGGSIGANVTPARHHPAPPGRRSWTSSARPCPPRFADQGLALFTTAAGSVPAGGGTPRAGWLRGLCAVDPGEPRRAGRCGPGARRHHRDRRQPHRRQRLHPQHRSGPDRLCRADRPHRQLRAGQPDPGRRGAARHPL